MAHEMRQAFDWARERGWKVERTKAGHSKLTHPVFGGPVFAPGTPSDWRSVKNFRGQIKRAERLAGGRSRNELALPDGHSEPAATPPVSLPRAAFSGAEIEALLLAICCSTMAAR